jgi:LysR family hydrogen peroxide-inducible transcriptional activator
MRGSWTTDSGVVARQLELPNARRRVSLVYRKSFTRKPALQALVQVILQHLPNTVSTIGGKPARKR